VRSELGNAAKFIRGITFKPKDKVANFSKGSMVCMRTKNVQSMLEENDLISVPYDFVKREEQYLQDGDILVSTANSWNLVGKCSWVSKLSYPATAGGFISILRAKRDKADPRYLYHWFSSPETQLYARNCGRQTTNISNMDINRCLKIKIPLPPLPEQKRIASILDKADALRIKRKQTIAKLDELLQSVLIEMFGNLAVNPKGFKVVSIDDVCNKVTDGTHDTPKRLDSGITFITGKHIRPFSIDFKNCDYVSSEDHKEIIKRCRPEKGDILYTNIGVNVGTAAMNNIEDTFSMKNVALLKLNKEMVSSRYIECLLNYPSMKEKILNSNSTGGAQKFLSLNKIKQILIPTPKRSIQDRFSIISQDIMRKKKYYMISLYKIDKLLSSLQQRAFKGEL